MPRKRMIDPKVWDDPDIQTLAPAERLLFFGLISHADDYGHISANPAQLRKWVFGYDDFTVDQVREMRDHILVRCHNVKLYQVDGQDYLWLVTWERQQDLRWRAKADYPCHACGSYHKHDNWDACKSAPVTAEALRNICATSTQDTRETLRTREEKRREENINHLRGADAPAVMAKPSSEDRQFWSVMAKVHHFAPNERNKNARGAWNDSIAVLRAAGAKPDEYPELYQLYRQVYPGGADTPPAIAKYADQLLGILHGSVPMPERDSRQNGRRPEPTAPLEYVQ